MKSLEILEKQTKKEFKFKSKKTLKKEITKLRFAIMLYMYNYQLITERDSTYWRAWFIKMNSILKYDGPIIIEKLMKKFEKITNELEFIVTKDQAEQLKEKMIKELIGDIKL